MKNILIIDDEISILHSIERQLKNDQYNLDIENNPENGILKIEKNNYDLVITDMIMKPITGLDVLKKIKTDYPHIPVIILTGYLDDKMMEQIKQIGCEDLLIKPIRKTILNQAIEKLFNK